VEFFRGDPRGSVFNGFLSTSQFISLVIFCFAMVAFALRRKAVVSRPQAIP
jgi:hypothetical protein